MMVVCPAVSRTHGTTFSVQWSKRSRLYIMKSSSDAQMGSTGTKLDAAGSDAWDRSKSVLINLGLDSEQAERALRKVNN